jgi:predicted DNA-binding protein YlxM (UPF0122 family)
MPPFDNPANLWAGTAAPSDQPAPNPANEWANPAPDVEEHFRQRHALEDIVSEESARANPPGVPLKVPEGVAATRLAGPGYEGPFEKEDVPRLQKRLRDAGLPEETVQQAMQGFLSPQAEQGRAFDRAVKTYQQQPEAFSENWRYRMMHGAYSPELGASPSPEQMYVLGKLPLLGGMSNYLSSDAGRAAQARFQAGQATKEDINTLAYLQVNQAREAAKSTGRKAIDLAAGMPAFLTEWSMLGGPAGYLGKAAEGAAAAGVGKGVLSGLAGIGTEAAVRTALRPDVMYERSQESGSAARGIGSAALENLIWSAVGGPIPGEGAFGKGFAGNFLKTMTASELNKEGQYALTGQGGSTLRRFLSAESPEEQKAALSDLAAEAAVFGGLAAGHAGAEKVKEAVNEGMKPEDVRWMQQHILDGLSPEPGAVVPPYKEAAVPYQFDPARGWLPNEQPQPSTGLPQPKLDAASDLPPPGPQEAPQAPPAAPEAPQAPEAAPAETTPPAQSQGPPVGWGNYQTLPVPPRTPPAVAPPAKMPKEELFRRLLEGEDIPGVGKTQARDLYLHHVEGQTLEEIAKARGVSREAIRQSVEKALQKLAPLVEEPPPATTAEREEKLTAERGELETGWQRTDRYEEAMNHLQDQMIEEIKHAPGGELQPDRVEFYDRELTALADEQAAGKGSGPAIKRALARRKAAAGVQPGGNPAEPPPVPGPAVGGVPAGDAAERAAPAPEAAAGGAPGGPGAAAGGEAAGDRLTPRQLSDALQQRHNDAQRRMLDAERRLAAAKSSIFRDRDQQVAAATADRNAAREEIGGRGWAPGRRPAPGSLLDRLEQARTAAAAEARPSGGPPAPERGTGLINPVPVRPGSTIVSGAVEVPLERPSPATSEANARKVYELQLRRGRAEEDALRFTRGLFPSLGADWTPGARPASIEEAFDRAGLSDRERHVIREGLKRRTLDDISQDAEVAKEGGQRVTAERVRQVATEALDKMARVAGKEKAGFSINDLFASGRADLAVNDVEEGRESHATTAAELHQPEGRARVRRRLSRLDRIDRQMESLADEYTQEKEKSGGTLAPEREAQYQARFARLDQQRTGRHQAPPAPAGGLPDEGAEAGGAGGRPGTPLAGSAGAAGEPDLSGRELLDVRAEARRRHAFAEQDYARQVSLRTEVRSLLRKLGVKDINLFSRRYADKDTDAIRKFDDLAKTFADTRPEDIGVAHGDDRAAAEKLFNLLSTPPEAPRLADAEARVHAEYLRVREQLREAEEGRGDEPEGATLGAPTEVEPGVLFHSSLRTPAKYKHVTPGQAAEILRSGQPTPQLTEGQRSLLEEHLLGKKSLNQIARERGFSSSNASMTFRIALRNLGRPDAPPTVPAAFRPQPQPSARRKYTAAGLLRMFDSGERPPEVTENQWRFMRAVHLEPDKPLGEIGRPLGVSKQAVHDAVKKGWARLAPFVKRPGHGEVVEAEEKGGLTPEDWEGMHSGSAGQSHALRPPHEAMADHLGNLIMGEQDDARRQELLDAYNAVVEEGARGDDRGPALAAAARRYGQETPAVLYHTPGQGTAAAGAGDRGPSAFEVNASVDRLLDVANYNVKTIPMNKNASAATLMRAQAVMTKKLEAGNPEIRLEEAAHIIAGRMGFEADPTKLPPDVREGLKQYVNPALHPTQVTPEVMHEGFAQWMIRRAQGLAHIGTPEQLAAAKYGEDFIQKNGLGEALDRVGDTYRQYAAQSAAQRYAGTISTTGEPAQPVGLTRGEKANTTAAGFVQRLQERVENDLAVLGRMVNDAVSKGMAKGRAAAQAMNTALALRFQARNWAEDWARHGYPEQQPDGSWQKGSMSYDQVFKLLSEEEAKEGGRYDVYAKARETINNFQREQAAVRQWQMSAAYRKANPKKPAETVTQDQHDEAQAAMRDLMKDPDFMRRADITNQYRVATLNAGLRFLVQIGRFKPETVENWIRSYPDYVSRQRVFDSMTEGFLDQKGRGGYAGGGSPSFAKARGQSGEQTESAMRTFRQRYEDVAALARRQLMDDPVRQLLRRPGMGDWAREMTADEPEDATKPIWRAFENGEPVRFMVKDAALWDYLSGRQGDGKASVMLANGLANLPIANLVPRAIRAGATLFSPVWHLRNMLPTRDPRVFLANTMNMRSAADIYPWYANWFRFMATGALAEGSAAKPYVDFYERLAGDSQRWITQGEDPGQVSRGRGSLRKSWDFDGFGGLAKEVLRRLSFPEVVPRALELRSMLDKMGINADAVKRWNETGEMPPLPQQVALLNAAAEVTHSYARQGADVRAWSKTIPFLGAHVANTSKYIRNFRDNPRGALTGLGVLAMMRLAYWAWNKDDRDYQETPVGQRNDFFFNTPLGRMKIAGPRGLDVPISALMDETLRYASRSNPHFDRLAPSLLEQVAPGGPEPISTVAELAANRDRSMGLAGSPIVPRADEGAGLGSNVVRHYAPFAADKLTGGAVSARTPTNLATMGFYSPGVPHQSVNDFYDRLHQVEAERDYARRQRAPYKGEGEYRRLKATEQAMNTLSAQVRITAGPLQDKLRQRQIELARQALGR